MIILGSVGCSGDPPNTDLPGSGPGLTAPPASKSPEDARKGDEEEAIAAYKAFWSATAKASRGPVDQIRSTLAPYAEGKYLAGQVKGLKRLRRFKRETWGLPQVHIIRVTVKGSTTVLRDCQDQSDLGLARAGSGELIEDTRGKPDVHLAADLSRGEDDQWRISSLTELDEPCSPEDSS